MHTTRSAKLRRVALLALPVLTLALGACTKTSYDSTTNIVEVTMAGGVNCSSQTNLTSCTNMREVSWGTDYIQVSDSLGRSKTVSWSELALPCGFGASRGCTPTEVLTKKVALSFQPCGTVTTKVRYARLPFAGSDVPNWVTETSTNPAGRDCPSNVLADPSA